MSNVVREDQANGTAVLTVQVKRENYEPKLKEQLKKYQREASLKGFRKGKTPMSAVRKMFGRSVLSELINTEIQENIFGYLQENEKQFVGQPLPSADQEPVVPSVKELEDYEYKFEIGIAPQFELRGLDDGHTFTVDKVDIPETEIDKEITRLKRGSGERESVETTIEDNDMVTLDARELENDVPKEGGLHKEIKVLVNQVRSEAVQEELKTLKVGDTLRFNVYELEKGDEQLVKKYLLGLEGDELEVLEFNPEMEAKITEVSRIKEAELNQEFLDQAFGEGKVADEAEAREYIRNQVNKMYDDQAAQLLNRDIQQHLLEANADQIELPETFLKRWLVANSEDVTPENVDAKFDNFRKGMRWSLIQERLLEQHAVEVRQEDIKNAFRDQVRGYFGGQMSQFGAGDDFLNGMVERLMSDQKQVENVYRDVQSGKLYEKLRAAVNTELNPISEAGFKAKIEAIQRENAAENADTAQATSEEE